MLFLALAVLVIVVALVVRALVPGPSISPREEGSPGDDVDEIALLDVLSDGDLDGRIEGP